MNLFISVRAFVFRFHKLVFLLQPKLRLDSPNPVTDVESIVSKVIREMLHWIMQTGGWYQGDWGYLLYKRDSDSLSIMDYYVIAFFLLYILDLCCVCFLDLCCVCFLDSLFRMHFVVKSWWQNVGTFFYVIGLIFKYITSNFSAGKTWLGFIMYIDWITGQKFGIFIF